MRKILFSLILSISVCFVLSITVSASNTIGSVNNYLQRQDFYNQINVERNPATTIADAGEESISAYNGAVAFTKQELNLPGKGGHNLVVERSFNSSQNINADGRSTIYSIGLKTNYIKDDDSDTPSIPELSDSVKYAFKYYLNGDSTTEPLYIVFDSVYDMFSAENGTNSIYLSENYQESLVDFGDKMSDGYYDTYYWSIDPSNTIGITLDSNVLAYENAESGTLEFKRETALPYGEVYTTSHFSYLYNRKYTRNLDSYIGMGWEYKMPMLQSVDDGLYTTSSSSEIYELTGCFYDPEWGYALDLYIKYTIPDRYPDRTQINKAYLYNPESYDYDNEKSNLYSADYIRLDENGNNLLSVIITRIDGKQFVFEDYEILREVKDAFGNSIKYDYDYTNNIVYITDTLNRDVVLAPDGVTVNGETVVEYIQTTENDDNVDPEELFSEDNTYVFKACYDVDSSNQKDVEYKIKPAARTVVLADTDQKINNHYNPERQTLAAEKLIIESVNLSTGAKVNYDYSIEEREENVSRTIKESCISRRYITQPNSSASRQITTYEYNENERIINEPGGKITTQSYRNKKGFLEYQKEEYPDKDYTVEKSYMQERNPEGVYRPTQIVTKETYGDNEISVTENYEYGDYSNQSMVETTRDGVLINVEMYKGKLLEYSRQKRADNEWVCTENEIENGRITESTYRTRNDSWTNLVTGYSNTYSYDSNGDLISSTVDGVTTNYTYVYGDYSADETPQNSIIVTKTIPSVENVIDSSGEKATADITEVIKYDAFGNVAETVDANGNITRYTYDKLSRPLTTTYPNNSTESVAYNDTLNTVTVTDRAGKITVLSYDDIGNNVSADVIAGNQQYTQYTKEYDNNGRLTKYTIHESGEPITEVLYEYYSDGQLKAERAYDANTDALMSEQIFAYNEITSTPERINTTAIKKSDTENLVVKQHFDVYGKPTKSIATNDDSSTATTETYTTDLLGNVLSLTNAANHTTTYTYDYLNRVTGETTPKGTYYYTYTGAYLTENMDRELNTTEYAYDSRGIRTTQTDATSRYTKSYFDPMGNLCRTEVGKDTTYDVTEYRYDNMNNLVYVITHPTADTSEVVKYTYDNVGNCTSMITGLTSIDETVNPQTHSITTYAYDINGNCISETNPLGNTKTATYNTLGYVASETDRMGQTATYTYDALMRQQQYSKGNASVGYSHDYYGNVISMLDSLGQVSYNYDVLGNLLSKTRGTTSLSYTYDDRSNRLTMAVSSTDYTRNHQYRYDVNNWVTQMTAGDVSFKYIYDQEGYVTKLYSRQNGSNKLITNYTFDKAYRTSTVANTPSGKSKVTRSASYNYAGNLISTKTSAGSVSYTYDGAGRLLTEKVGNDITTYTYDARGNRISKVSPTETVTYTYDLANKLLSMTKTSGEVAETTNYTYDLNGNLTSKQCENDTVTYTYTSLGQLASITDSATQTTTTYTYDGNNLRQSKTVTPADGTAVTTKYIYDGTNLVAEVVDANNYKGYMYAANTGGISIMVTPDGNYFLNNNVLQDIEKVTNASGNTVQETGFDAFGNKYAIAGTELCPVGYRGEYHDAESGLIYLHNRYYDPEIGRFITEDPVKDGSNWYVYCGNNPVNYIDPLGLDAWLIHGTNLNNDPTPEKTWTQDFRNYLEKNVLSKGEKTYTPRWSGGNDKNSREKAAEQIAQEIITYHQNNPDEKIRLIGHSHGGNVAVMVVNILAEKNIDVETLVTIATPVREYQLKKGVTVKQHINVYNNSDQVQVRGGHVALQVASNLLFGISGTSAGRTFKNAININAKDAGQWYNPIDSHSSMHSNIAIWKKYIAPKFKK